MSKNRHSEAELARQRAEALLVREQIVALVDKFPQKAGKILTEWIHSSENKKAQVKKKAG